MTTILLCLSTVMNIATLVGLVLLYREVSALLDFFFNHKS
jgi:hypothetical protein